MSAPSDFLAPPPVGRDALRAVAQKDPALVALLRAAMERYVRSGSWITKGIALTTPELRAAVHGLGLRRATTRVSMKALDAALARTRFQCGLEEAVRWVLGDPPPTRAESTSLRHRRREAERDALVTLAGAAVREVTAWLSRATTRRHRDLSVSSHAHAAQIAVRAAAFTSTLDVPNVVPILAHHLTGDPHALDVGRRARRYFERILLEKHSDLGLQRPLSAGDRAALLAASNLAADGISSLVWAVGLVSDNAMLRAAREGWYALGLPLMTLAAIDDITAYEQVAFAVENRSVFGALVPALADLPSATRPTMICTSGNPTLAARVLLRRLAERGVTIHYGGDTDARGLAITRALESVAGSQLRRWHMDVPDHEVRYQESALADMLADLRRIAEGGKHAQQPTGS